MPANRLVERGGVALVCFNLARMGYQYAVTEPDCPAGDVWAQIGNRKIGIEVKTTGTGSHWHVKRSQTATVDFYCLVRLDLGQCHILTATEVSQAIEGCKDIYAGVADLREKDLPRDSFNGWHRLGMKRSYGKPPPPLGRAKSKIHYRTARTVRHMLANGEIKTYVYPPSDQDPAEKFAKKT